MIGKALAHYEITAQIGKGGMGEVYQAKDTKLGRDVAIKVLPEEFAQAPDRVARFQREAKLLASLNHPNIAAIYGLEESGGTNFIVLELVEGDTLADRIKRGPIPVEDSLKLAIQIAEALEAAHEKGVIHRDLKPANIKVTPEGKVKVLDFGLAKAFTGETPTAELSNSPTLSDIATRQGVILGTSAYMSPEQATGKSVDKRADIWSFGVVLFEMLTGKKLFGGETVTETIADVIKGQPEWSSLPRDLHPRIRFLLERCLEKTPKNRSSGISDARVDIQSVLADPSGVPTQAVAASNIKRGPRLGFSGVVATIVLVAIITGLAVWSLKPSPPHQTMRFDYTIPKNQQINDNLFGNLAISPDGRQFVYATPGGLYLRAMGEYRAKLIAGTETAPTCPFFSPDGQWIGYWSQADNKLKKIALSGGGSAFICDVNMFLGADWGADDTIVFGEYGKGILRVSANGGTPELLAKQTGLFLAGPQLLPDGKAILYSQVEADGSKVIVQSPDPGEPRVLIRGDSARYLPTGHLAFMDGYTLFAIFFDPVRLEVKGGPVPLVEGVYRPGDQNAPQFAISDSGTLVYMPLIPNAAATSGGSTAQRTLVWVDRTGKEEPLDTAPDNYNSLRISPDGAKVALSIETGGNSDIYIRDLVGDTETRLTFDDADDSLPLWTRDGRRIVFYSDRDGILGGIYWKAADGTGEVEQLLRGVSDRVFLPGSLSGNGSILTLNEFNLTPLNMDIGMLSMEGRPGRKALLHETHNEMEPQISPDGKWMAYESTKTGKIEIYVCPFPDVNAGRWQVSKDVGYSPLWSPDGRELFYRSGGAVLSVGVETDPVFKPNNPKTLFKGTFYTAGSAQQTVGVARAPWDITPDGKRFLMIKPGMAADGKPGEESAMESPRTINIVLNWFEELKERVPVE